MLLPSVLLVLLALQEQHVIAGPWTTESTPSTKYATGARSWGIDTIYDGYAAMMRTEWYSMVLHGVLLGLLLAVCYTGSFSTRRNFDAPSLALATGDVLPMPLVSHNDTTLHVPIPPPVLRNDTGMCRNRAPPNY